MTAEEIIEQLQLAPLMIEGGYFLEMYRASLVIPSAALPSEYDGDRNACTAIYYLLTPDTFSEIHRLPTDELFHFYLGDPVEMLQLHADGRGEMVRIGKDLAAGERPQVLAAGGVWQGSRLAAGGTVALLGCTVAPGFDYADYTSGERDELLEQYPQFAAQIKALTRE